MSRTTNDPKTKRITLAISEAGLSELTNLSETFGMSKSEAVREAVKFYKEYLESKALLEIEEQARKAKAKAQDDFIGKYLRTK